jgi:hypothetical protein
VNPFNEAGFEDDWSYARVAWNLARTGRLEYNGWGGSLLLFQSFWALPWIRIFGFSFQILEISTIPLSLGAALLIYLAGLRLGLSRPYTAFASLGSALCPLLLPFAASFMTESCACFFSMLCIYCAIRTAQAESSTQATGWLWRLAAAGLVGGANRQIVWVAGLAPILWLLWARRAEPIFRRHALICLVFCAVGAFAIQRTFGQPYGALHLGGTSLQELALRFPRHTAYTLLRLMLVVPLMAIPAFACFLPRIRWWALEIAAILSVPELLAGGLLAPFGETILTRTGIATTLQDSGDSAFSALSPLLCLLLTAIVNAWIIESALSFRAVLRSCSAPQRSALAVFALFGAAYLAMLIPGALTNIAYDRYMAPLVPLLFLAISMQARRCRERIPFLAWVCLALFSGYAVATTHDHFAKLRAGLMAAHKLEAAGVPRNRISAGKEYDGWTQLCYTRRVRGVEYTDEFADETAKGFWFESWDHLPNVHPDYVILNWNRPEPPRGCVESVEFHAWLPPHRRTVAMWKRDDLTAELFLARWLSESHTGL